MCSSKDSTKKDVSFRKYKKNYLLSPERDPRKVLPRVVSQLQAIGFDVKVVDAEENIGGNQGSGFVISSEGHILTVAHVLDKENVATVWINGKRFETTLVQRDNKKDLAVLKIKDLKYFSAKPLQILTEFRGHNT